VERGNRVTAYEYDEPAMLRRLNTLGLRQRVAFAALCAERLLRAQNALLREAHAPELDKPSLILAKLWGDLAGEAMTPEELKISLERCVTLAPTEDEAWELPEALTAEACCAVAYSLGCRLSGDAQEAEWAARQSYNALDFFVGTTYDIDYSKPGGEERLLEHPLVQRELCRQQRDLAELAESANLEEETLQQMRRRAEVEAETMFTATSSEKL
jgi:uncharacterized protein